MRVIGLDFETALVKNVKQLTRKSIVVGTHVPISYQLYSDDLNLLKKQNWVFSTELETFTQFLTKKTRNTYFACANLNFDLAVLIKLLQDTDYELSVFYNKSRPVKVKVCKKQLKWYFLDIFNLYGRVGVRKLGEIVGVRKLEKPVWLGVRPPQSYEEERLLMEYGIQDAKIHYLAAKKLFELWKVKAFTAGSLALKHFKKHLKQELGMSWHVPHFKPEILRKLAKAYHGGRVECLVRGSHFGKLYYYDVNGLYPYVMANYSYPYISKEKEGKYVHKFDVDLEAEGIAKVLIYQDSNLPPLGVKRQVQVEMAGGQRVAVERYVFPRGHVLDWFTFPELRYLEETGEGVLLKVFEAFEWRRKWNPFTNWVQSLAKIREENPELKHFVKIPLNSLYGKLGEKRNMRIITVSEGNIVKNYPERNGETVYARHACIPIAAYVTAYSRLYLHQLAKRLDGKLFYIDTDSLFTTQTLPTGRKLGELSLKNEARSDDQSIFVRSKFYLMGETVACRGWHNPPPAPVVKALIMKGDIVIKQMNFSTLVQALRQHIPVLSEIHQEKVISTNEDGKRQYNKILRKQQLLVEQTDSQPVYLDECGLERKLEWR